MSRQSLSPLDLVVVIPSFNQCRLLAECLDSVQADMRASGLRCRLVVVDNASWDGSAAMVRERYPEATVVVPGHGLPGGRELLDRSIELVEAAGMRGFHAGSIANAAAVEAMTSVLIFVNKQYQCHAGIKLTGLPEAG